MSFQEKVIGIRNGVLTNYYGEEIKGLNDRINNSRNINRENTKETLEIQI